MVSPQTRVGYPARPFCRGSYAKQRPERPLREFQPRQHLFRAVRLNMMLGSFFGVVRGMNRVSLGQMRMVRRHFMIARLMVFGGFPVVVGRMLMVLGGLRVMVSSFFRHRSSFH
jgi:hypothetical protein